MNTQFLLELSKTSRKASNRNHPSVS